LSGHSVSQRAPRSVFSEFYNCDAEWSEVNVIDEAELAEVKELFSNLQGDIQLLKDNQPKCSLHPQTYEKDYARYCEEVNRVFEKCDRLRERVAALFVSPEKLAQLDASIAKLAGYVENNDNNWVYDMKYFSSVVEKLMDLREDFTPEKLRLAAGLQEMSKTLQQNDAELESLLEPTHHWIEDGPKSRHCDKCCKHIPQLLK
jgi:hypothetical protein